MTILSAIPSATYRLQLHGGFTFADAEARLDYFAALGISHLYLSPILTARAGSQHGYDVVDHGRVNPELGGEGPLRSLSRACRTWGLGLIVDIVPNHMAVGGGDNGLWLELLERGRASPSARFFDVDFDTPTPGLSGKVLAPFLGEPYGQALAEGKISLIWDAALGKLTFAYGPHRFPLRPEDYAEVCGAGAPEKADLSRWRDAGRLHALLERQNFRLAWWRAAGDAINWRRFFDVTELAGLRIEDEAVFERVHETIFRLYGEGVIDGVRVDHVDGLADPPAYARALRARLTALNTQRPAEAPGDGPWLVVEKILGEDETLPTDWGVDGTSGYDFMDEVGALLHDPSGQATLDALWTELSGRSTDFEAEEARARGEILHGAFSGQLAACARAFEAVAQAETTSRDLTAEGFRRALAGLIRDIRIYRSYANGEGSGDEQPLGEGLARALQAARVAALADWPWLDFVEQTLIGQAASAPALRAEAARRLNQLTAPVAAKAVEDTAFYRYSRLLSRNDVGFDPRRLGLPSAAFLEGGARRARDWPRAMLTTATHDHKRGEDVRARLAVLSELAGEWGEAVRGWMAMAKALGAPAIAADDAYALFQTLLGAWPLSLAADDAAGLAAFAERLAGWREKSLREAKLRSSWAAPDLDYEAANQAFLRGLLDPARAGAFLQSLTAFVHRIAPAGAINGVTQAVLRCAWPGVPDLYQGAEFWDFSLVDPDNRRPVDYAARAASLAAGAQDWTSGAVKQTAIARLLALRRAEPELFTCGAVTPTPVRGQRAGHMLAFERRLGQRRVRIAVMLRVAGAIRTLGELPGAAWWGDSEIETADGWSRAHALFGGAPFHLET
ncbi:MAG: malto-oligosyltrehalose synthase [Caulobacteraceae bacterium]|nr:malto-oligosyltrehalose synthase [Caulobacteraceae bacterium]